MSAQQLRGQCQEFHHLASGKPYQPTHPGQQLRSHLPSCRCLSGCRLHPIQRNHSPLHHSPCLPCRSHPEWLCQPCRAMSAQQLRGQCQEFHHLASGKPYQPTHPGQQLRSHLPSCRCLSGCRLHPIQRNHSPLHHSPCLPCRSHPEWLCQPCRAMSAQQLRGQCQEFHHLASGKPYQPTHPGQQLRSHLPSCRCLSGCRLHPIQRNHSPLLHSPCLPFRSHPEWLYQRHPGNPEHLVPGRSLVCHRLASDKLYQQHPTNPARLGQGLFQEFPSMASDRPLHRQLLRCGS